jgi:hypothetical protein
MGVSRRSFLKSSAGLLALLASGDLSFGASTTEDEYKLKKLAIYYGWPSAVHDLGEGGSGVDHAVQVFSQYDTIILGRDVELPTHGDYTNLQDIIAKLPNKEIQGYTFFSPLPDYRPISDNEREQRIEYMKKLGMSGVLFDQVDPGFKSSVESIEKAAEAAHGRKMHVTYVANFYATNGWLEERITPFAKEGDQLLIEPFGTSWAQDSYPIPKELHPSMLKLRDRGVKIIGVSTYNIGIPPSKTQVLSVLEPKEREILMQRFLKYRQEAQRLKLDAWQFTNGWYSASGKEANLLVNFDALVK